MERTRNPGKDYQQHKKRNILKKHQNGLMVLWKMKWEHQIVEQKKIIFQTLRYFKKRERNN